MVKQLLAVFLPVLEAAPNNTPAPVPRVGGFPGKTMIGNHTYARRTFSHVTREAEEAVCVPDPHTTLLEHQQRALSEHGHLGEVWVQHVG